MKIRAMAIHAGVEPRERLWVTLLDDGQEVDVNYRLGFSRDRGFYRRPRCYSCASLDCEHTRFVLRVIEPPSLTPEIV